MRRFVVLLLESLEKAKNKDFRKEVINMNMEVVEPVWRPRLLSCASSRRDATAPEAKYLCAS